MSLVLCAQLFPCEEPFNFLKSYLKEKGIFHLFSIILGEAQVPWLILQYTIYAGLHFFKDYTNLLNSKYNKHTAIIPANFGKCQGCRLQRRQ